MLCWIRIACGLQPTQITSANERLMLGLPLRQATCAVRCVNQCAGKAQAGEVTWFRNVFYNDDPSCTDKGGSRDRRDAPTC